MMEVDRTQFARVWQLFGYDVLDTGGTRVGTVERVWTDNATASLKFIGIKTGWFLRPTHVIPARDEQIDDRLHAIRVGYLAAALLGAPSHNTDISLTNEQERKVAAYYETV